MDPTRSQARAFLSDQQLLLLDKIAEAVNLIPAVIKARSLNIVEYAPDYR